jgi:hypothetical protein
MALDVVNVAGLISKAQLRKRFENTITQSSALRPNTPLGIVLLNGEFHHYANPDTDTLWLGFVLGMRHAERDALKLKASFDE